MSVNLKQLAGEIAPPGAEWCGLRRVRLSARAVQAKDGRFDLAYDYVDEGCMVEVLYRGQFGYAAVASLDSGALSRAALRALELARVGSARPVHAFDRSVRPDTVVKWETRRAPGRLPGSDELCAFAIDATRAMRSSEKIVRSDFLFELRDEEMEYASTSGAAIAQLKHVIGYNATAVAREGSLTQRRTLNGPRGRTLQGGAELLDFPAMKDEALMAAAQAVELLSAPECPSDRRDLVLAPDQMMLQIHESVGHPIELDRILGDERNFAGSSFVRLEDLGTLRYGSELMNISFDPGVESEPASYAADDIGNPARKELLIDKGILVRALGSLESQARSGKAGVANQRAQLWFRAPIDRMANLNLEPGASSLDEIIGSVEKGVWMEANRSWSIDDYRNKFQFGCEYGRLIENGKLGKVVRNPNYRGVSSGFWRSLFKVGDASTFRVYGTPNCGKGEPNQVIDVGHASPVCAFRDVEVFGGEA
ncbi:MAG TPA: TldD/PmbA family protein [Spirochaetales bacterium]|nr:TldD/PmbA family protein [Spirochaetales bacterium]